MTGNFHEKPCNKKPSLGNTVLRILSFILALLLSLSALFNLGSTVKSISFLFMAIFGQIEADAYQLGYASGSIASTALFVFLGILLFRYSLKSRANKVSICDTNNNFENKKLCSH